MQLNQIKQQFTQVERVIEQATQAIQTDNLASPELKDTVRQLGTKFSETKQLLQKSQDEAGILRSIDDLEETGDRAKKAVESGNVSSQMKNAILQVHEHISTLKKQAH